MTLQMKPDVSLFPPPSEATTKWDEEKKFNKKIKVPQASSFTQNGIVTISVGPNAQRYEVHSELIRQKSSFFDKCLQQGFSHHDTHLIELKEDSPAGFEVLLTWFYHGYVDDNIAESHQTMCDAYEMADRFYMLEAKNKIFDAFYTHCKSELVKIEVLQIMIAKDMEHLQLYKFAMATFVLDFWKVTATSWDPSGSESVRQDADLMREILDNLVLCQRDGYPDPGKQAACVYHDHSDGGSCD